MAPYPELTLEESRAGTGLRRLVGHGRERPAEDETAEAFEQLRAGRCMTPGAGDCRLKRSPPWANASTSSGCGFAAVSRPVRATPAGTPTTICVAS